jgi:predicted HAD superfamily hydrolase
MISSFDIFDTCLTRRVAIPSEVFDRIAVQHHLGRAFKFSRQEAEREACRRHGEATLDEIYEILATWLGWNEAEKDCIKNAEMVEETIHLTAVPDTLEKVRKSRMKGNKVVFITDMYLPSSFLVERLREHGFYEDGDAIMVSCEYRKSKMGGQLFAEAIKIYGEEAWQHTGNCITADVIWAKKAGIATNHHSVANLTKYEDQILDWSKHGNHIGSSWAGASRQARISLGPLTDSERGIVTISTGVAAPLLLAYVTWIYHRVTSLGLKKVYFLARDGQILRDIFIQIAKAKGSEIEARYLYASRISLRFPRHFPMTNAEADGVFQANTTLPISILALRLGITEAELSPFLPSDCVSRGTVLKSRVAACRKALDSSEACLLLNKIAHKREKLLEEYLQQQGLMDGESFGLVDLGWACSLQEGIINSITNAKHNSTIHGLYLGLHSFSNKLINAEAFCFDSRWSPAFDVAWFKAIAELFCQADHGSTLGFYSTPSGIISPLLDEIDNDNPKAPNWLALHQEAIRRFTKFVIDADTIPDSPSSYNRLLRNQLRSFYFSPSRSEAEVWGQCRFSSHGSALIKAPLAPLPSTLKDFIWTLGIKRFGEGKAIWPYGAAARCPAPIAFFARILYKIINHIRPIKF